MMEEREVTVRVQKVKKNRIRMKLFFFASAGYDICKTVVSL